MNVQDHPLMRRSIKVYRSVAPDDHDYVAVIHGLSFAFRASGAFKAKKAAEDWRLGEAEKLVLGQKEAARRRKTRAGVSA